MLEQQSKQAEFESSRRYAKTQLAQLKENENRIRAQLNEEQAQLNTHIENAKKVAPERTENIRPVTEIVAQIEKLERRVRQIQAHIIEPEQLKIEYTTMHEKYTKMQSMWNDLKNEMEQLRTAYLKRKDYYKKIQKYFIRLMTHEFEKVLEFRQFKGTANVNVDAKTLDLVVIPHQGTQGVIKNANLSGGERSFTTVAFLYALWNCTNLPFYILDEFDVYMVKKGRKTIRIEIILFILG